MFALLFTVFFTNPDGLRAGVVDGLAYWLDQQPENRGGEPWYFYLAVLFGEGGPVLLLGAVGMVWTARHPTTQRLFLIWAFFVSLAIYSWASERFSWLVLHPLLPLILLAGIGVQALWVGRRRRMRLAAGGGRGPASPTRGWRGASPTPATAPTRATGSSPPSPPSTSSGWSTASRTSRRA